ncbi:MAG: helix-turn-helix domain-containing protein [Actinomycetota bacterium]
MKVNMKVKEVGEFIRSQRAGAQMSLRKLAKVAGVSNPYLSQVERGLRRPSAEMLQAIAKALRVSSQTLYVKAGILEDEPHPDVHTAVMADTELSEQQKQVLLQVYDSFRDETGRRRVSTRTVVQKRAPSSSGKAARKASSKTTGKVSSKVSSNAPNVSTLRKSSTARTSRTTRMSSKLGGRAEMQADPSPHPAPLRPSAANVHAPTTRKPRKEVG